MYKHPFSALLRLIPALLWVGVAVAVLWWFFLLTFELFATPEQWADIENPRLTVLFVAGFLGVGVYSLREAYKEYMAVRPALHRDTPINFGLEAFRRPKPYIHTVTDPLTDAQKIKLRELTETLETHGLLQPGEVTLQEIVDCTEQGYDSADVQVPDIHVLLSALSALQGQGERRLANLAFFPAQSEADETDAVAMVREFARLAGRSKELTAISIKAIGGGKLLPARSGEFPPPNAVAEFTLGTRPCVVPFVLYSKNLPGGLMERLARVFTRADDPRQFVWGYFDAFMAVSYLSPAQSKALNATLPRDCDHFEPIDAPEQVPRQA